MRGNNVMKGYFADPEATATAFAGGWFHSGDIGVMHPDGYIELRDRKKDIIISGGENISTIEVEQTIARHPAVHECAVVAIPDDTWGERPKAFVTLAPGSEATEREIIDFCREHLAHFKARSRSSSASSRRPRRARCRSTSCARRSGRAARSASTERAQLSPRANLRESLRDLPRSLIPSTWIGALAAALISFSAPVVILQQASDAAGIGVEGFGSWLAAVAIGGGVASIALSLVYRMPIMCAWSTPGAALLVTSIADYPYSAVIGAYVAAALVTLLVGVTGVFRRLMALVPEPVVMGVLAGVLFRFGVGLVTAVPDAPEIVVPMIAAYLLTSRMGYRAPAIVAIAIGVLIAAVLGRIAPETVHAGLSDPVFTRPTFALDAIVGIGLPLFVLTMAAQNRPASAFCARAATPTRRSTA